MDKHSIEILHKVWKHTGISGNVWIPSITSIGTPNERFHQGNEIPYPFIVDNEFKQDRDWYWTPAISLGSRKKEDFPAQRVVWVDCDDGYNISALKALSPSILWETSPGHTQAIWLMSEEIAPEEYSTNGLLGLLVSVTKADKSGVDIGQLLRVPGTYHHKQAAFKGRVLRNRNTQFSISTLLKLVCRYVGFTPQIASEISDPSPYGDRSKQLWKFSSIASSVGVDKDIVFKILNVSKWNKWKSDPQRLRDDIDKAYRINPPKEEREEDSQEESEEDSPYEVLPWEMSTLQSFGDIALNPIKWVIPRFIPESGCGLLVAAPKVGKTRIAIELMLGCATGTSVFGISINHKIPVGFFSLEDGEHLFSRRLDMGINLDSKRAKYHWFGHIDTELVWHKSVMIPIFISFDQIDLSSEEGKQRLLLSVQKYSLKLVIIDTLSMAIGGSNVNNSTDMYLILKDIKAIAKDTGCAVMFIHHTRKRVFDKGESIQEKVLGSTALHAWSDFIISLDRPSNESPIKLQVQTKMGSDTLTLSDDLRVINNPYE